MSKDIKKIIAQEYIKCAKDPAYFMRKYCHIQHPTRGRILFNLYPFQDKILQLFKDNDYIITLKSRQLGISTLAAAYSLWLMLFHKDKNVLALATTQATARNLVTKVIFMYDQLPKWLRLASTEKNKLSLRLKNGSKITAKSSSPDAARSEAGSLLLMDEAAFIENVDETFTAAQQTLATGGQCMALSTPNGVGNWFHQTWEKAESGENSFLPIRLPWTVHPERDQKWREQQDSDLGPRMAGQECDCDFLASGDTVFEPDDMLFYEQTYQKDPLERRGVDSNLWVWEGVDYTKSYMVVADVARGDSTDYSACHVIDVEEASQVAEYRGKLDTKDFGNFLVSLATEYNNALLVVENANIGWAVIQQVIDRGYQNLFYMSKDLKYVDVEHQLSNKYRAQERNMVAGFSTTSKTRPLIISKLEEYVREKSVTIRSSRLIDELFTFIWSGNRAEAMRGYNDDLTMSLAISLWVRDTALRLRQEGIDLTKQALGGIGAHSLDLGGMGFGGNTSMDENPWQMRVGDSNEDLTWLIK